MDGDKAKYSNYYDACLPLLRTGSLIVSDNVLWELGNYRIPRPCSPAVAVAEGGKFRKSSRRRRFPP